MRKNLGLMVELTMAGHIAIMAPAWADHNATAPSALKLGEYLSTDYIRSLEHSATPSEANAGPGPCFARARQAPSGETELTIGTFHDGWVQVLLDRTGHVKVVYPKHGGFGFQHHPDSQFSVAFEPSRVETRFRYVGNLDQFLAQLFITGTYQTIDGRRYIFTKGVADIDGQRMPYAIDSSADEGMDILVLGDRRYRFTRSGRDLSLYSDLSGKAAARPQLVLKYLGRSGP